jgi:hypothetical protein
MVLFISRDMPYLVLIIIIFINNDLLFELPINRQFKC